MQTKFNTITIGISAFNEQENIARLVNGILLQKTTGARKIMSITIVSDGSTDNTVSELAKINDKRITIVKCTKRKGKNTRLNQIFKSVNSDILILFDADIILEGQFVVDALAKAFRKGQNIGFVAGNAQPVKGKTIVERASNNFIESLNYMKSKVKRGQNIYSVRGPVLAYSNTLMNKFTFPVDVPDDRYSFLICKKLGFDFYYESSAKVYFRSPKNLYDQLTQCRRFRKDRDSLERYFDSKTLNDEYYLPLILKIQAAIYQVLHDPLAYVVMKYIQVRDRLSNDKPVKNTWEIALTTKSFL